MIWNFIAGLGIFIFSMRMMETSLKSLASRTFKLFLKKHTGNKFKAILSGTFITGLLQSSSVVTLMVLAFVGAGVMSMRNGIAVVFGSNFGTTLDSWMVAFVGFNINIENLSLPIIGIAGLGSIFFKSDKLRNLSLFALGFGFLFLGIHYMKTSIGFLLTDFDFSAYTDYNRFFFIFLGFVITSLIQSSSATMVILLSALNTGVIPFHSAVAIVIGSELGTSIKIIIGSIGGIPAKKRIALGNTIFNLVVTFLATLFMIPLIHLVVGIAGESNQLISLVLFQSIINFTGLIIFYPFLERFGDFLENYFSDMNLNSCMYISKVSSKVPDVAMDAVEKEVNLFMTRISVLNLNAFHVDNFVINHPDFNEFTNTKSRAKHLYMKNYEECKEAEGEIYAFYAAMRKENMEEENERRMEHLVLAVRNAMYSAKSMKDVLHNRISFRESSNDLKYDYYKLFQEKLIRFYNEVNRIMFMQGKSICFGELVQLLEQVHQEYVTLNQKIYDQVGEVNFSAIDFSTQLNLNREIFSSKKSFIQSMKFILLDEKQIADFDSLSIRKV